MLLFGVIGVTLYFGLLNVGLFFTGAGSAALLQAGIPAITTLLSVLFLKERVSRLQLLGISLSGAGLLLVMGNSVGKGGSSPLLGNLLIAGSVLAWAIYTVQGKHLSSTFPWLVVTTASIGVGVICLLPFALGEVLWQGLPHLHADGLMQLLYLGGVSSALGYGLWNYGLRFLDASQAAPYFNLIPVVGLLLSVLVLHEPLTLIQVGGGVFTLLGVSLSSKGPSGGRS
jgi:drug/metabolite transporter (DMT)-like permease